jgi:hypothetical protein
VSRNPGHMTVYIYISHSLLIKSVTDKRTVLEVRHCVPCIVVLNDNFDIWLPLFPCASRAAEVTGSSERDKIRICCHRAQHTLSNNSVLMLNAESFKFANS